LNNGNSVPPTPSVKLPYGSCPNCLQLIDRNLTKVSKPFPCPQCGQLVRTTRSFRFWMSAIPTTVAAYATWHSRIPLPFKFIEWPLLWFGFTCIHIWVFSILRRPLIERFDKKDDDEFQKLGLQK